MTKEEEEELKTEINFMYSLYEELCVAYKKLSKEMANKKLTEVNDMSHMTFKNEKEIM
jgi:hypothetical protein